MIDLTNSQSATVKFQGINEYPQKKLRVLRNSLNNRLKQFENGGPKVPPLRPSHRLYSLDQNQCEDLLKTVKILLQKS